MKLWFVIIFFVLTLAISGVFYWQLKGRSTVPSSTPTLIKSSTDIPPLFPQASWDEFVPVPNEGYKSLGEQGLYSQGEIYGYIRTNGQEWTASKSNLDEVSMTELLKDFRSYYDKKLSTMGWGTYYEDQKYNFSPLAADGAGGSMWGYVKVKDGKLREVLLATFTPIEDFGGMAKCPCNVGFRVFVSEAVPLEELIRRVEE